MYQCFKEAERLLKTMYNLNDHQHHLIPFKKQKKFTVCVNCQMTDEAVEEVPTSIIHVICVLKKTQNELTNKTYILNHNRDAVHFAFFIH